MKKIKTILLVIMAFVIAFSSSGCMGSFIVTKAVYKANEEITDNKYVNNILFILIGSWLYPTCVGIDACILNVIEFWTGTNPIALKEGQSEKKIVKGKDDKKYEIEFTKNQIQINQLGINTKTEIRTIVFYPEQSKCVVSSNNMTKATIEFDQFKNVVSVTKSNGSKIYINEYANNIAYNNFSSFSINN